MTEPPKETFAQRAEREMPDLCIYDPVADGTGDPEFLGTYLTRFDGRGRHRSIADALFDMRWSHLPNGIGTVSRQFCILAYRMANDGPENSRMSLALTRLCEAKDLAVRAHVRALHDGEPIPAPWLD